MLLLLFSLFFTLVVGDSDTCHVAPGCGGPWNPCKCVGSCPGVPGELSYFIKCEGYAHPEEHQFQSCDCIVDVMALLYVCTVNLISISRCTNRFSLKLMYICTFKVVRSEVVSQGRGVYFHAWRIIIISIIKESCYV